jgi:hypothetical protein
VNNISDSDLSRELEEACSRAEELIARIQKRLDEGPSSPERVEFLLAHVREVRLQRALALLTANALLAPQAKDQRGREALVIRKAILAIRLQVTRLAGILEALLDPHH